MVFGWSLCIGERNEFFATLKQSEVISTKKFTTESRRTRRKQLLLRSAVVSLRLYFITTTHDLKKIIA